MRRSWICALLAAGAAFAGAPAAGAETTLRAVLGAEIVTLDPYFTNAYA